MDDDARRRYARHLMLPEWGEAAQEKLAAARVLVIGAGGLGSPLISYLTAGGVGHIGVIDHDHVELSNLSRQILFEEGDIGRLKVESAGDRISELNSHIAVELFPRRFTPELASLLTRYDLVADGCDDFATRLAVNAACVAHKKPLVSAAVTGFNGQLASFAPHLSESQPCYQCLVPSLPPAADNCREVGVIGPLCGVIGSLQALEVMKIIAGLSDLLFGRLLRVDGLNYRQQISHIRRNPDCPICAS